GYSVVYDSDLQQYCYALILDGRFISSGSPITKSPPAGIRKHLRESSRVRTDKFRNRFDRMHTVSRNSSDLRMRTFGVNNGLMEGRRVSCGKVKGLTILVHFADVLASITKDDVDSLLNADRYTQNGNYSSVREYFLKMSNGNLDYSCTVLGPIKLSKPRDYYIDHSFIPEALQVAVRDFGIDLALFDSRNEGIVDALNFLYAGRTVYEGELWPHNSQVDFKHNGIRSNYYMLTSMGREPIDLSIGTFCHENGHQLCRFPDLYDYGDRDDDEIKSEGMGTYCLMSAGNHLNSGRTPAPICAYLRYLAGWHSREVLLNEPCRHSIIHSDYSTIHKYKTVKENEFFLVENRYQTELDSFLPSSGLAVYHCDTMGSNEWQSGTRSQHYQCALLQADGHLDLESGRNCGDSGDLFGQISGIALSHTTLPGSLLWDGSDSGFVISDIDKPGPEISFSTSPISTDKNIIEVETKADLIIPDNSPAGVTSEMIIAKTGNAKRISVALELLHRGIGDLQVELEAPSGKKVFLHNRTGGKSNDIKSTFDSDSILSSLIDELINGTWKLIVRDLAKGNKGKINSWKLIIEYSSSDKKSVGAASPGIDIPDNSSIGVDSKIDIADIGKVSGLKVCFEIEHPYVGDLVVTLSAPGGKSAILHNKTGGSRRNISATYDSLTSKLLDPLMNESIKGNWTLNVADLWMQDKGQLKKWSIEILYR
ncbi:MAG: M6 family metalloprotease domain-containing protein, partial [Fibrobacterota bacterium]